MTLGRDYRKKSAPNTNEPDSLNASAIKLDTISRRPSTSNASAAGLPRSNSINSLHSRKPSEDFLPSPQRSPIVTRRPSAATSVGGNEPPASPSKRVFGRRTSSFRGAPTTGADKTLPLPISTSQSVESQIFRDELSDSPSPIGGGTSASYRGGDYGYGDTMKLPRRGTESSINPPASEISFSESSSMDDKVIPLLFLFLMRRKVVILIGFPCVGRFESRPTTMDVDLYMFPLTPAMKSCFLQSVRNSATKICC